MKPLPLKEKEYRLSLLHSQRRAIIPLKWIVIVVTFSLGGLLLESTPGPPVLALLGLYVLHTLFETWYFYLGRVGLDRIKPFTLISYLVDVVFVTMLIYFDIATFHLSEGPHSNFYILYFLLVLRGFALFSTVIETIMMNALISMLFILILYLQHASFSFIRSPEFVFQIVLVWLVVLMGWFIMVVLNQQKMDLIRVHEQLMRADNLARLGALAAGVAHEINNPLGIISSTAEYMKKAEGAKSPHAEEIEAIYRESNRCKEIVQQMLAYARPKKGEPTLLNPVALNDEVLQFVFPRNRTPNLEIVRQYDDSLPPFRADPNLIKQSLLNLYMNARQAIPKGREGKIVSRIYRTRHPLGVAFEVEDNGSGIDPEDIEHVCDPFFTRKSEGTGLGLSITQRIVESFDGTIHLEPIQPHGTRVRMEFPAAKT